MAILNLVMTGTKLTLKEIVRFLFYFQLLEKKHIINEGRKRRISLMFCCVASNSGILGQKCYLIQLILKGLGFYSFAEQSVYLNISIVTQSVIKAWRGAHISILVMFRMT